MVDIVNGHGYWLCSRIGFMDVPGNKYCVYMYILAIYYSTL